MRYTGPLHEAAEQKFVEVIEERVARRGAPLKSWREQRGLSQVALAEKSGVSLRAIQQYEQRCKNINHGQGSIALSARPNAGLPH